MGIRTNQAPTAAGSGLTSSGNTISIATGHDTVVAALWQSSAAISSASPTDVAGLSIPVTAGKKYKIDGNLLIDNSVDGEIAFAVGAPAGSVTLTTAVLTYSAEQYNSSPEAPWKFTAINTLQTNMYLDPNTSNSPAGRSGRIVLKGTLVIGDTDGNVTIQAAMQGLGTNTKVGAGNYIELTEIS